MKQTRLLLAFLVFASSLQLGHAAQLFWDASLTPATPSGGSGTWNLSNANWSNGAADIAWTDATGFADTAVFGGSASSAAVVLGTNVGTKGIVFNSTGTPGYTISGSTLLLGASGINASSLSSGLTTISSGLTLVSGQTWNVGSGATLALNSGTFTRGNSATLNFSGAGLVTSSMPGLANDSSENSGLLGAWATIGTGASTNYAALSAGNITGYTYLSSGAANAIPTGATGATNYKITTAAAAVYGAASRTVNVLYNTAGVSSVTMGNSASTIQLVANGVLNSGTGLLTIAKGGSGASSGVQIGATKELVLNAANAGITVTAPIFNNSGGASGVNSTASGANLVTLSGVNAYTGATSVTGGTLTVTGTGAINTSSGIAINGNNAKYLHASTTAGTVPITLTAGTLDGTGSLGATTVGDDTGGIVANGNGGNSSLTLSALTFNGGATANVRSATTAAGLVVTGALTTNGANGTVVLNATNSWSTGSTYNLISYGSFAGTLADFSKGTLTGLGPRQAATLVDTGTAIAVSITGEKVVWTGFVNGNWTTAAIGGAKNWKLQTAGTGTEFFNGDDVVFDDSAPGTTTVNISTANVDTGSVTVNNDSKAYTINSSGGFGISSGSLVKSGAANLTLTTTNTYAGPTTINGGILTLGDGTTDGTIANTSAVTNNGAMVYNWSGTRTAGYAITGTGSLAKQGTGTLTLTGANTYTGGTTISGGRLIAAPTALNGGGISIGSSGSLTFNASQTSTSTVTGAGSILNSNAVTVVITGDHTGFTGTFNHNAASNNTQFNTAVSTSENAAYSLTAGELIFAGNGDYTVKMGSLASAAGNIRGGNAATGTTTLELGHLGTSTAIAGNVNNGTTKTIAVSKVGDGTLSIAGTNTYSGLTSITGGTLALTGAGTINASSGISINGVTAKYLHSSSVASTVPISIASGTLDGTGGVGAVTVVDDTTATVANGNGAAAGLTLASLAFAGDATVNVRPVGTSAGLAVTGALTTNSVNGTVVLNASNIWSIGNTYNLIGYGTFGGILSDFTKGTITGLSPRQTATIVDTGTAIALSIGGEKIVWTGSASGAWTTNAVGGARNWKGQTGGVAGEFFVGDDVIFDDSAPGTSIVDITTANVTPGSVAVNNPTKNYTIGSSGGFGIASGSLVKSGAASLTLTTTNTYTGATVINGGALVLGDGTTDGTIANTSGVTDNGALVYNWSGAHTAAYPIVGTGSLAKLGAGTLTLTGANTYTGGTTISGGKLVGNVNGLNGGPISIASGGTLTFTGTNQISTSTVTGSGAILNNVANVIVITGDHTGFTGTFTQNSASNTQFNSAVSASENAAYSQIAGELLFAANGDYTVKMGSLATTGGTVRGGNTATGTTTLEIGHLGTSTSIAGNLNNGTTKVLALRKVGAGTLTLTGANTYSGATTIVGGTLQLGNGTINGTNASTSGIANGGALVYNTAAAQTAAYVISGTGSVTKSGTGTLTLSGVNTYTGGTTVNGGSVAVNGTSLSDSGTLAINGGKVDVTGTEVVDKLFIDSVAKAVGTYGATGSGATFTDDAHFTGSGVVSVTNTGTAYESWAASKGLTSANNGPNQDPDGDGISNLLEFVLSGNPLAGDSSISPAIYADPNNLAISFSRNDDSQAGVTLTGQWSTDLGVWHDIPVGASDSPGVVVQSNGALPDTIIVYVAKTNQVNGKLFLRLKASN